MATVNTDAAAIILRKLKQGHLTSGFTERDVYRPQWSGLKDREAISSALQMLADHDWLRAERVDTGGRPLNLWHTNPAALQ
jgi:putative DNA primase/helicase